MNTKKKLFDFKEKVNLDFPSPKEALKTGVSLGVVGLGLGFFNKFSGGNL